MQYDQPVFRPPSEAQSLIFQATLGCSHGRCTFCSMYRTKRFKPRPRQQLQREMAEARAVLGPDVPRVFLADGDAMCLSPRRLDELLDDLNQTFPGLQRVAAYANARDVLAKSPEQLSRLRRGKLGMLYMGLESGDPQTLQRVQKGATVEQIVQAVQRAQEAEITVSVMVLIGLAGRQRSLIHARASAEAITLMSPAYTALLTYTPVAGSPLFDELEAGRFELPGPRRSLEEIREFVHCLGDELQTYFTCNHASNYLPLKGHLPAARADLVTMLDAALAGEVALKPEFMRGL